MKKRTEKLTEHCPVCGGQVKLNNNSACSRCDSNIPDIRKDYNTLKRIPSNETTSTDNEGRKPDIRPTVFRR